MKARRAMHGGTWLLALVAGCSYGGGNETPVVSVNSCSMTSDCMDGSACSNNMCIAQKADAPLQIALQVTPRRMADGLESLPSLLTMITVEEPTTREFKLFRPIGVKGSVLGAEAQPIEAEVSFTPTANIRGITRKAIASSVTPSVTGANYEVELLSDVEYRMIVRPKDVSLPPYYQTVLARNGEAPEVIYPAPDQLHTERVNVTDDGDTGLTFLVRALNPVTGEQLSSTAMTVGGIAELRFLTKPEAFSIEVRAEQVIPRTEDTSKPQMLENGYGYCDRDAPAFPVFTARTQDLETDAKGVFAVTLPELPSRIRFEGRVTLCPAALAAKATLESLPVSLHATSLTLPAGSPLSAAFDATTTAALDRTTGELAFCVQVIPGNYDVVATPISSMPCALFAEDRTIAAPSGAESAGAMLLKLPDPAYLSGNLFTMDGIPLRGASIDAIAIAGGARSRPAATDNDGGFKLQVDLGRYDVVVKPATGTGLPWQVRYMVNIGRPSDFTTEIPMYLPVTVNGSLVYRNPTSTDPSVADAAVVAFAIVEDEMGDRAVPIGSTTADATGHFTLLLPPSIQSGWLAPKY